MTETELRSFFADYGTRFLQTEVEIAAFYGAPCMTARQGIVHVHATRDHIQAFFAEVLRRPCAGQYPRRHAQLQIDSSWHERYRGDHHLGLQECSWPNTLGVHVRLQSLQRIRGLENPASNHA